MSGALKHCKDGSVKSDEMNRDCRLDLQVSEAEHLLRNQIEAVATTGDSRAGRLLR
jgi:hypothetical protein